MLENIKVFFKNLSGENFTDLFFEGLWNTVKIAILGLIIGIVIGTVIGIIKVAPKYKLGMRILDKISTVYVAIFRGTPMVAQLLIAYYLLLPLLGVKGVEAVNVGVAVFGMNSGAYVSEIMRGGINSVDPGQTEAGRALGLSYPTTMLKIVVPQAIKNIIPTLGNEFITLIKDTAVLSFISIVDINVAVKQIAQPGYVYSAGYLFMAVVYIVLVLVITGLVKLTEHFLNKSDRKYGTTKSAKKS
ncbi:MAG: amino acid ABC transporter permease [Clostridia bacterium]|nr:amino acid ABC transporter permease [Clostridia bacterium]